MKKILSLIALFSLSISLSFAEEAKETFNYNEQKINADFKQLEKIEKYVQKNEGTTLESLKSQNSELVSGINLSADASASLMADELPLGIPAFWWGCVLGIIGILIVYLVTDKDKDQTKKALFGCLIWTGIWILYAVFINSLFW
ncbi:hypothetical protein GVN16_11255 [Emticicia sp. CRIBPO]|uniref:hypothetical protein n=1 Tax=Emticicia sp. CRIBPO TaxID=2683258 RepID=UPI001411B805|nr:hypothetical protein [Emticicia sp. CRIBPO]NBA86344.1 hypothetical protein [Emticicia sp. CRIBPO]